MAAGAYGATALPTSMPFLPVRAAAPGPSREPRAGPSIPPVVATLPPIGRAPDLGPAPRSRLSADSKLLAAGGALAAAMLLVAVGVLLGQRSAGPSAVSAAASGPYPVVVETKAATAALLPAGPATPAALPVETRPAVPAPAAVRVEAATTVEVQQLPPASPPRAQGWSVAAAAPKAPAGPLEGPPRLDRRARADPPCRPDPGGCRRRSGAVAAGRASGGRCRRGAAHHGRRSRSARSFGRSARSAPVDPLVQAVREDIREDESRARTR